MKKIKSINVKFQLYLMTVVLIIITITVILTQHFTNSYVDRLVKDNLIQWGKDFESLVEPDFLYFNYPHLASQVDEILKEKAEDFLVLFYPDGKEIIHGGIEFDHNLVELKDKLIIKKFTLPRTGEDYHIITIPVKAQNSETVWGYIAYGHSMKDKRQVVSTIRNLILFSSLLLFVCAVIVLRLIIKKITTPIKTIKEGFEMLSRGNMSFRIHLETKDEFEFLADKFNEMGERLEEMMKEVESTRKDLENLVDERTKALNSTNEKLKEAMAKLKDTQKRIIQTETHKSLTSIVSGFAHEINNPLTGILGYIDLMEMNDDLSSYSKKRLGGIKDQALRIKESIDNLNLLDPDTKQVKIQVDLSNLLEKLIKIIAKEKENKGIHFEKDFPEEKIVVFGNHFALWQVFEGIIENSVEAIIGRNIEKGSIRVILKKSPDHSYVIIVIIDNGGGFENIDKALNPFYTTKDRTQKRGIGLSIAFNLIQEHEGNIIVNNNNTGATVTVHLPLPQEDRKKKEKEKNYKK